MNENTKKMAIESLCDALSALSEKLYVLADQHIHDAIFLLRECKPEYEEDIIKCVSPEDKKLHKALRNALIKPEQKYKLKNRFCDERYAAPETIKKKQSKFREKISALFMDCNADINHSGEITQENNIRIWRLLEEACARLETAEAEKEAARDLWINAQKACKKHALRADKAEAEIERRNAEIIPASCPSWTGNKCNEAEDVQERIKELEDEAERMNNWMRQHFIENCSDSECEKDCKECPKVYKWIKQALKDKDVSNTDK